MRHYNDITPVSLSVGRRFVGFWMQNHLNMIKKSLKETISTDIINVETNNMIINHRYNKI